MTEEPTQKEEKKLSEAQELMSQFLTREVPAEYNDLIYADGTTDQNGWRSHRLFEKV